MDFTSCHSQPDVSPEELAKKALAEKADLVIASGGDGTVGAVAGVLVNTGDYQRQQQAGPIYKHPALLTVLHVRLP